MQYQFTDFISHAGQQLIALVFFYRACINNRVNQNLDIDFMVRAIYTRRIINRISMQSHTGLRRLNAAQLREAQIAALGYHLAAQFIAVNTQCVCGAITDFRVALKTRFHIRANAAVVEKINRRFQNGAHQFNRRRRINRVINAQHRLDLRREWNRFSTAGKHAAALAYQRFVVIVPA